MRKYYYAGGVRVAMRTGSYTPKYLLTGDASHALSTGLGSTMVQGKTLAPLRSHAINAKHDGTLNGEKRYMLLHFVQDRLRGEERYTSGTTPTSLQYTGQHIESLLGIYFYQSRWYDPKLSRFLQADSIVPDPYNSQAWDRFAYGYGNPINRVDPTGHETCFPKQCGYMHDYDDNRPATEWIQKIAEEYYRTVNPTSIPTANPTFSAVQTQLAEPPSPADLMQPTFTPETYYNPIPTQTPDSGGELTVAEMLALLRKMTGEIDPGIPGAFTGTNLGYKELIEQAGEVLNAYSPANPYSKTIRDLVPESLLFAIGYNIIYDQVTNTGEYSQDWNIRDITPTQAIFTIIVILIAVPVLPP